MEATKQKKPRCRFCGSVRLALAGFVWGPHGKQQRFRCVRCGKNSTRPWGLTKKDGG